MQPSFGIADSNSPVFCSQQALKSISIVRSETGSENVRQTHQNLNGTLKLSFLEENNGGSSTYIPKPKEALGMVNSEIARSVTNIIIKEDTMCSLGYHIPSRVLVTLSISCKRLSPFQS